MSEQTSQEPTMEEILASIRRIISEDDAPAEEAAAAAPAPEPAAAEAPEPAPAPEPEDDEPLELTERVETHGDLDVYTPPEPEPAAAPAPEPEPAPVPVAAAAPVVEPTLVSDQAATVAASAFGQLSAAMLMPKEGRTLEDVVQELLRPLLQQWLDQNLPAIVQQAVDSEVDRIARSRAR